MIQLAPIYAAPGGMNQDVKPWEIPDGQARMIVDGVLDKEAELNRRGPVKSGTSPYTFAADATEKAIGIIATEGVDQDWKLAVLHGTAATSKISFFQNSYATRNERRYSPDAQLTYFDPSYRYRYSTSAHPRGGAFVGTSRQGGQATIGHWGGGTLDDYTTGQVSATKGSKTITGTSTSWDDGTDIEKGMFLYAVTDHATSAGKTYIGQIKSVNSATSLTLVDESPFDITTRNYKITSVRALDKRVAKGTITCTTSSAVVDGANTKFKRQKLHTGGPWVLLRADDMTYIGKVTSVASDTQLTLTSNAEITCNKDKYIAVDMSGDFVKLQNDATDYGWLTAQFAGRTWYANRHYSNNAQPYSASRVWFSDIIEPEAVDRTADGDHIFVPSAHPPVRAITAIYGLPNCLVVWKDNETYAIYGTDESNFALKKIDVDDGAMSPMTVQPYQEGVVFAGKNGIWFFDGNECFNILEGKMENWWQKSMTNAAYRANPPTSMLYKGQYVIHVPAATPASGPDRSDNQTGAEEGTPYNHVTLCIDLQRRASTIWTNFALVGAVQSPAEETLGTVYVVNKVADSTPYALTGFRLCYARDLFESQGLDTITTGLLTNTADQLGPDFFFESKRYDLGQQQLKKRFKQLQMYYRLDTLTGAFIINGNNTITTNFGYETIGATAFDYPAGFKIASKFTTATALDITSIKAYLSGLGAGSGSQTFKAMIYSDNAGSPDALLATSSAVVITDGQAAGWVSFPVTYSAEAGTYWLGLIADNADQSAQGHYNAVGTNTYDVIGDAYGDGPSNPFGSGTLLNRTLSIYAVATDSSGADDYTDNALNFATMVGLNELSTTSNSKWNPTRALNSQTPRVWKAGYQNKRIKFNKRSTHLGFKMWQTNRTGITSLRIGPMALGYKEMRPGRV